MEISFSLVTTFFVGLILVLVTVMYVNARTKDKYDIGKNKVELETLRSSLEARIYDLMNRLEMTEARWKDINHLLISSQNQIPENDKSSKVPISNFLKALGVKSKNFKIDQELVFVLTPFHKEFDKTFETIALVCREIGLKCLRGDETYILENVVNHIIPLMASARVVVANIEGRNPNVFYELGIAHAIDKPTILVSRSADIPVFDIKARRIIFYSSEEDLRKGLKDELLRILVND